MNTEELTNKLITWIRDWFNENGRDCNAIIGMSGGKDSTICAALLCAAIGPDRVIGVMMPDTDQGLNDADKICEYFNMNHIIVDISNITRSFKHTIEHSTYNIGLSKQSIMNIPPRVRMTTLYAIGQTYNGRVINTCNMSENYLGYFTIFGDSAGDMSPLGNFTVSQIYEIGDYLKIPHKWVHKTPDDGLPNSTSDEEKFGFSYEVLDKYLTDNIIPDDETMHKIQEWHQRNAFKMLNTPTFIP
jgi:NAD+ synthase